MTGGILYQVYRAMLEQPLRWLEWLDTLKVERLQLPTSVTDEEIVILFGGKYGGKRFSELRMLDLECCSNITGSQMHGIDTIDCAPHIFRRIRAGASLATVGRASPNLQSLNLDRCRNITDASMEEIRESFSNLRSLNLTWCTNITEIGGLTNVFNGCQHLQSLSLEGCDNITQLGLMILGRLCPNLQSLNLNRCLKITDAELVEVGRGFPHLRTLALCFCSRITDAGLVRVAIGCQNLQSLDLWGCDRITPACKNALRQRPAKYGQPLTLLEGLEGLEEAPSIFRYYLEVLPNLHNLNYNANKYLVGKKIRISIFFKKKKSNHTSVHKFTSSMICTPGPT